MQILPYFAENVRSEKVIASEAKQSQTQQLFSLAIVHEIAVALRASQ